MIARIIDYSLANRPLVILSAAVIVLAGVFSMARIPIDAIPDLSDTQVILYTEYPGQAPQVIEDQVTYPLTSAMLAVPRARYVRGYSFFGFSLVYIIFEDGTDMYWARSRVLEYVNTAAARLPANVQPTLGPDASGVGWVYIYALSDPTGENDLQELRSLQDWVLRYELASVDGVSEVASVGGFVKQYQVKVDPSRLIHHDIELKTVQERLARSNRDAGARLIEMGETEYMVRSLGYIQSVEDIRQTVLKSDTTGNPITIGDVARVELGPEIRRGIAEWNGEGEVVGGIVVMRQGEDTTDVIDRVKARLEELKPSLPPGVEIHTAYDRSVLIDTAITNISIRLIEEMLIVAAIVALFLLHVRSSLVAIITLPIGILGAFVVMFALGINANLMSLGGIAIAIGVMIDASVVLVENLHKHMERAPAEARHIDIVRASAIEVGPALFFSLLIITVSFLPVLALGGQAGRLFGPLAVTKTLAMAVAALLAITLIPVLMSWFVRGGVRPEADNPVSRFLSAAYRPLLIKCLEHRRLVFVATGIVALLTMIPLYTGIPGVKRAIESEFMPPLNEGDILYMPTTLPGISITKAREILQRTDRLIRTIPEVKSVFGKVGRAETATDPAPLSMIETHIVLKDPSEWRAGMDIDDIRQELNETVRIPGLTNSWTFPIQTRIDMLSTGIKTEVGLKVLGNDLDTLARVAQQLEALLTQMEGTESVIAERVTGGRYVDYEINRVEAARHGLTIDDIQNVIMTAVGGQNVTYTVEGLARYPVNIRYPRELRDDIHKLGDIWLRTPTGAYIPIDQVSDLRIVNGPPMIKTENARQTAWIYIDLADGVAVGGFVDRARETIARAIEANEIRIPAGVTLNWSGQYEYLARNAERNRIVAALTVAAVVLLLYLHFRNGQDTLIMCLATGFALVGGVWLMWFSGYDNSIATLVGFVALAGLAAETGIVMLLYLRHALDEAVLDSEESIRSAILRGAVERVRPKMMTVATTMLGLTPMLFGSAPGARIMSRLAVPMIGGLITSTILTLILLPLIYEAIYVYRLKRGSLESRAEPVTKMKGERE